MKIHKRWRGLQAHRLNRPMNKLERRFARAWQHINTDCGRGRGEAPSTLTSMLSDAAPPVECSDRDREVANTVIQWLGSPVGEVWVRDVLREHTGASDLTDDEFDFLKTLEFADPGDRQTMRGILRKLGRHQ